MYQKKPVCTISNESGCSAATERDTPEVVRALADVNQVVERYDNIVGRLHDRLHCVCVPSSPIVEEPKESPCFQTQLASSINETRCKLRDITDALESLYSRIEL